MSHAPFAPCLGRRAWWACSTVDQDARISTPVRTNQKQERSLEERVGRGGTITQHKKMVQQRWQLSRGVERLQVRWGRTSSF